MSEFLFYLLAFLLVLGVLIVVHEWGHYLVARLCGVKVLRFSVGFGKALWCRRLGRDGTEWAIGVFPLGGYVKMLDEREGEVPPCEAHRAYNRQSVGRRSLIVAAGPAANFLLAILIYWGLFCVGSQELLPVLGSPPADSPAAQIGIRNGEQVRALDGEIVETWQDFRWLLLQKAVHQEEVELEVLDERKQLAFRRLSLSALREEGWQGDGFKRLGLVFFQPPPVIGQVSPGSAADRSGLRPGDRVIAIDDVAIDTWLELQRRVQKSAGRTLHLMVLRENSRMSVDITPERAEYKGEMIGRIGVSGQVWSGLTAEIRYDFGVAGGRALRETWEKSLFSLIMMGKMLTGEVSWRNLSGPLTIADYAGQSARLGLDHYLKFLALVSVSLGVLNLLPIPILDGGHLLYHMIEVIKRGPLSERAMETGQQIGLALLLVLMAFAFFNDINRLFSG